MARQLVIDIDPLGAVKIDAQGFSGKSCLKASAPLEQVLGKAESREEKPELLLAVDAEQQVNLDG